MSFNEFNRDLKNKMLGNNIFMYGAEWFLTEWAINTVIDRNCTAEDRKYVVSELDGQSCTANEIVEIANTMTMFASLRILTVKNYLPLFKKSKAEETNLILSYLEKPNPGTMLIFYIEPQFSPGKNDKLNTFAAKVSRLCKTYNFERLNTRELKGFVNKRVRNARKLIGARDLDYLIDITGYKNKDSYYDLNRLESDLNKLVNATDEDVIKRQLIEEIMIGDKDKFVFNFIDYLLAGKKSEAMQLLINTIAAGESNKSKGNIFGLSVTLIGQFEMMYDALELDEKGMSFKDMAKNLKVNEFRLKKAYSAAKKIGIKRVRNALVELYDSDRKLKTGEMDKATALELFVFNWSSI